MSFQLAEPAGQDAPRIYERDQAAGASWNMGALLLVDASGNFAECGADPAAIAAVACTGAGTDTSGFNVFAKKGFPPGKMQAIALRAGLKFAARYVGTLPAADGGSYGVVRDADGLWKVDFSDTTATRVKLTGRRTASPENVPMVIVEFLIANIQVF
jgi:hypothetical protein